MDVKNPPHSITAEDRYTVGEHGAEIFITKGLVFFNEKSPTFPDDKNAFTRDHKIC